MKCDATTPMSSDIERGNLNIVIGFAPLRPAEFVIVHIQQFAGYLPNEGGRTNADDTKFKVITKRCAPSQNFTGHLVCIAEVSSLTRS